MIDSDDDDDQFEDADSLLAEGVEHLLQLKDAIRRLYGCESEYAGREEVMETFQDEDELVWNGYVEIFNLSGHPQATKCYAWSDFTGEDDEGERFITVLKLPPIDSPEAAVRAVIMAEIKSATEEFKKDLGS